MKNRIETTIEQAQKENRVAFIGLVPIDPVSMDCSMQIADTMIASGVDILMIHIPNWMPWMEGRVLQLAAKAPRNAGVTRVQIFAFMKELRQKYPHVPLVDMTLYDTAMTMGQDMFFHLSAEADVDGFDLPNYPLCYTDDRFGFYKLCLEQNRHLILAISYELATAAEGTKEYELLCKMCQKARGFVFVMNAPGGQSGSEQKLSQQQLTSAVGRVKSMMKQYDNKCYVSIVCGISDEDDIVKVKESGAECFMIGSAYIDYLQRGQTQDEVGQYLRRIRKACSY